jgi:hypothetical protein
MKRARFARKSRPLKSEGAGNAGRRCARSRACSVVNTRVSHHGHTGNTRHSPRNGFNGFLHALPGDRACLPPSLADCSANLTPASGRQDHTTSPSASAPFVCVFRPKTQLRRCCRVHRIPCPTFVTIAKRPSVGRDGGSSKSDLGVRRSRIFFAEGLDSQMSDLPVGQISKSSRRT